MGFSFINVGVESFAAGFRFYLLNLLVVSVSIV